MRSRLSIFLIVLAVAAMGTFGFGLMGHGAQHMCPVVEFLGYECPQQAQNGANFGVHHLSTFKALSRVTTTAGAGFDMIFLLLGIVMVAITGLVLDSKSNYYQQYRSTSKEREESVFVSRQQFSHWFALHIIHDSYA